MFLDQVIIKVVEQAAIRGGEDAMAKLGQAAQNITPRKTGQLRGSFRVETEGHVIRLVAGSGGHTPYAAIQERGIGPGGQPFQNYTTPGTGPHYMEHTLDFKWPDIIRDVAGNIRRELGRL